MNGVTCNEYDNVRGVLALIFNIMFGRPIKGEDKLW